MTQRIFALLLLLPLAAQAQTFSQVRSVSAQEVREAETEYSRVQDQIADEKIPLRERLEALEDQALRLRREATEASRLADAASIDINALQRQVSGLQDNNEYLLSLLSDYIRRFQSQIHVAEDQLYAEAIRSTLNLLDSEDATETDKFDSQLGILDLSLERSNKITGGYTFNGLALAGGGEETVTTEVNGTFAVYGPIVFFSGDNVNGVAVTDSQSASALIYPVSHPATPNIATLVSSGEATVPVDATLGEAQKGASLERGLVEEIKAGGLVMPFMLGIAGIAFIIFLFKLFEITGTKTASFRDLETVLNHLRQNNKEAALSHAKGLSGPGGELLVAGVEHADEDKEVLEEVLYEVIIKAQPKLERFLPFIAVTAATAPLLGLLGTVTGMIKTFQLITVFGTGDARSLSTGISEALITTKFGLIIAIPSLIGHAILNRMARTKVGNLEQTAISFVNGIAEMREDNKQDVA